MKVYLVDIYLAKNLGDDMFLDHLASSYPDTTFVPFYPGKHYNVFFAQYDNIRKFPYTLKDKIYGKLGITNKLKDYNLMAAKYDGLIFMGGGIFREENYWKSVYRYRNSITNAFLKKDKKVSFIGCNFGPYQTEEFKNKYQTLFEKCEIISFRDQKSYRSFNDLANVAYAPDALWDYKLPSVTKKSKTLGISIIDPKHKFGLKQYHNDYVKNHQAVIQEYLKEGFQIKLFSFCEKEGDLQVCKEIAKTAPNRIEIHNYNGDIRNYLAEFGACSKIIAARFHAIIIAMKYGTPVLPIIYGEKTRNILEDLQFENKSIEFDNLDTMQKINSQTYIYPRIDDFIKNANKHFNFI